MARDRTVKGLAKRIELTYYQRLHPFRRLWRVLCIGATGLAALWLVIEAVRGDQRIYTSGPVVTAHRMFETDCARCHIDKARPATAPGAGPTGSAAPPPPPRLLPAAATAPGRGGFFARVSDGACLTCHDGSVHHDTETRELTCATCHLEHKVGNTLARMSDRHCTICHADLQTKTGKTEFERQVVSLAKHPEFAVFRKNQKDETAIKLNHEIHQKEGLPAGGGKRVTLGCVSCHVQDDAGRYMKPISYDQHCKECHPLEAAPDVVVPHQRPEIIHGWLLARFGGGRGAGGAAPPAGAAPEKPADKPAEEESVPKGRRRAPSAELTDPALRLVSVRVGEAVATDAGRPPIQLVQGRRRGGGGEEPAEKPAEEGQAGSGRRRGGGGEPAPAAPGGGAPGGGGAGAARVADMERELFQGRQGCPFCHTVQKTEPLPTIVPPKIPVRWQRHASFDHRAHRPLACAGCHEAARKSADTADVLLPTLQVCQECHRAGGGARAGCPECHIYHDRSKERSPDGPHSVPQFLAKEAPAAPAKKP